MEKILVFIPMYNCQQQIVRVLKQFDQEIQSRFTEVLVVDNRSTDDSVAVAKQGLTELKHIRGTLVQNDANYNLGGSHKVAFQYCLDHDFDYCVVLHGDDQADIHDLLPQLDSGAHREHDSILGSRFMKESQLKGYSGFRIFGNRVFNNIFSLVSCRRITDLGSGLNMYQAGYLKSHFYLPFPNDLTFNNYMVLSGVAQKSRFMFFPISWREEDQRSNVKMIRQAFKTLGIALSYLYARKRFSVSSQTTNSSSSYTCQVLAQYENGESTSASPTKSGAEQSEQ